MWWKEEFIRLYQKSGRTDFNELQDTVSTLNEGTNSLVTSESEPHRWFVMHRHKTSTIKFTMVVLISPIVGVLILYSKNILGQRNLSDSFHGGLFTAPARF